MRLRLPFIVLLLALKLYAQENAESSTVMKQVLERLDSLEKQNQELVKEVHSLREQLNASGPNVKPSASDTDQVRQSAPDEPTVDERLTVQERRTEEQAVTKVEAAHKYPIQLNGMLLFNAFANSASIVNTAAYGPNSMYEYGLLTGPNRSGATIRQTLLGFDFQGPKLPGNGQVNGTLMMDFFGGSANPALSRFRLRRADISFDWKDRSFTVGQDKPLISPYQPDSLAEVGIPALAGSGNLWLWLPQARYEERMHFGASNGLTGQVAVLQTDETYNILPSQFANSLEQARPALEGRLAFWHKIDDTRRLEFAPGFHVSTTHVGGASVPSHIASLDWLIVPSPFVRLSGTFFTGQNVAGLGSLGNGFVIMSNRYVHPVNSTGGWAQLAFPITSRLTWNVFSGVENDNNSYLSNSNIVHNWSYASNLIYHLGPNVVVGIEALQMRARYLSGRHEIQNHYDFAIGYLF